MTIRTRPVPYRVDGDDFEGVLAWDDGTADPRPGVLVAHTIRGRTDFEVERACELAKLGYVGLALDVYGVGHIGAEPDVARQLMDGLRDDRPLLQRRLLAGVDVLTEQAEVDSGRLAGIGFCFGGLAVLDLARIAAPLAGVVSFHGLFVPPGDAARRTSDVRVLALHGWDDPLATPDAVVGLGEELTSLGCDWQIHAYGHTMHAFTNPAAADSDRGTVYNATANRRSRAAMTNFLAELFG